MSIDLVKLAAFIGNIDQNSGEDLMYSLELTKSSLITADESMKRKMSDAMTQHDFDTAQDILSKAQDLNQVTEYVERCIQALVPELSIADPEDFIPDETSFDPDRATTEAIDYSLYRVSHAERHYLTENFTHKKICAFEFDGHKYRVGNWQDAIVRLCKIMAEKDSVKFDSLVDMDIFHGRSNDTFSREEVQGRNRKVPGTDIYVWINYSAIMITKCMLKILEQYGYDEEDLIVYLRADYTPLHE